MAPRRPLPDSEKVKEEESQRRFWSWMIGSLLLVLLAVAAVLWFVGTGPTGP